MVHSIISVATLVSTIISFDGVQGLLFPFLNNRFHIRTSQLLLYRSEDGGIHNSNVQQNVQIGSIALVGAGPGSPDLLTIQAMRLIKEADLVISDRLVSKDILDLIECELKIARKRPGCAELAQDEIYEWTRDAFKAGKNIVRLKIGDPFLFGRGGEEIIEFRKLGVEPIVVPGVSSSYAAPLSANIPLTHRGTSNSVLITTGYGKDSSIIEVPEYCSDRTVVLLMAVGRIEEIASNMTMKGYPVDTPVAIIERATTPQQRTLLGTLGTIGAIAKRDNAQAPSTIIVGEVVNVLRIDNSTSVNVMNSDMRNDDAILVNELETLKQVQTPPVPIIKVPN